MDVQFYGANCVVLASKELRIVVDDNLPQLGGSAVTREGDVALYTGPHETPTTQPRMLIDMPGEYEVANVSITGIPARSHLAEDKSDQSATMYKIVAGEVTYLVTGHVYPELTEDELEAIGMVDVLFVPVGGHGFTLDPLGALKLTRNIDPKLVVPTHYDDKALKYEVPQETLDNALQGLSMEPTARVDKLRVKPAELSETTHLLVLEKA